VLGANDDTVETAERKRTRDKELDVNFIVVCWRRWKL
jgi:hypothetical protein